MVQLDQAFAAPALTVKVLAIVKDVPNRDMRTQYDIAVGHH